MTVGETSGPFHPAASACNPGDDLQRPIQELTSLMVSSLEEARKRDREVDARHIVAQVSEALRRRGPALATLHRARERAFFPTAAGRAGAFVVQRRTLVPSHPQPDAAAAWLAEFHSDGHRAGIKLDMTKSAANVELPGREGTLNFRNRKAVLTLGCPKIGLSYRFQLTSSRMEARAPAAEGSPRSSFGTAACALIAAGILLHALPEFRTKQPEGLSLSLLQTEKKIAPKPYLPISPPASPIFSMLPPSLEQGDLIVEPAPAPAPAAERVATRTTTSIRVRPEQPGEVVRVVPGQLILTVYARDADWVQVGGSEAWGWVPSNLLVPLRP